MDSYQYKQLVCLNGHQISVETDMDAEIDEYCEKCGAKVTDECSNCHTKINGYLYMSGVIETPHVSVPNYCLHCGKPYPWTETAIDSLEELINLTQLDIQRQNDLKESIPDLIGDTPKATLAAYKWKKFGQPILSVAKDIFVDIVSEATLKLLYGN